MYFENFPLIIYDSVGDGNFKVVTNLLKRVALRSNVRANTLLYDTYDVKEGETPEMIADKLYGDSNLHWVVLYVNGITDRYHQWPMSTPQFLAFLNDKYDNHINPRTGVEQKVSSHHAGDCARCAHHRNGRERVRHDLHKPRSHPCGKIE